MKRDALIRDLRRYGKRNGLAVDFDASAAKGGHGVVTVGDKSTVVKSGDLSNVYVQVILKQLGLPKDAI